MFYDGDLQTGINTAIQQSKFVACFVRDDESESIKWEEEYLTDTRIASLFADRTILLRLEAGSQEAGFLAALFPLPKTPTLVIIQNGQLREYLNAGISKEDFLRRLVSILGAESGPAAPIEVAEASTPPPADEYSDLNPHVSQSRAVRTLLDERRLRMEEKKKEQDAADKAEAATRALARKEALNTIIDTSNPKEKADMKYALMQKKRQQEAREERARILKRVEDDKAERRAKEALRRDQAKPLDEPHSREHMLHSSIHSSAALNSRECAVQVRLFDGTTIRSRFPSYNTLAKDVRTWIDGQRIDGDTPYNFKQILTPLANRTITISEEEDTLQTLGLTPSTTLIIVPVKDFTSAYDRKSTSYLSIGFSTGLGLISSGISLVTGTLGSLMGSGSAVDGAPRQDNLPNPEANSVEHQFYNGNALNFEPRRDDDERRD